MFKLPGFVDLAMSKKETEDKYSSLAAQPDKPLYPYGTSLCLTDDELDKLNLDANCEVGDRLFLGCIAEVTSVSKNATTDGERNRVELQITHMAVEDGGEEEVEQPMSQSRKVDYGKFYKSE